VEGDTSEPEERRVSEGGEERENVGVDADVEDLVVGRALRGLRENVGEGRREDADSGLNVRLVACAQDNTGATF